jgi:hypothetical protein
VFTLCIQTTGLGTWGRGSGNSWRRGLGSPDNEFTQFIYALPTIALLRPSFLTGYNQDALGSDPVARKIAKTGKDSFGQFQIIDRNAKDGFGRTPIDILPTVPARAGKRERCNFFNIGVHG